MYVADLAQKERSGDCIAILDGGVSLIISVASASASTSAAAWWQCCDGE